MERSELVRQQLLAGLVRVWDASLSAWVWIKPKDEPFCDACQQHTPCSCDDMDADRK